MILWSMTTSTMSTTGDMGARFKCKKCKRTFNINDGRGAIQKEIDKCEHINCTLKHRSLTYIPVKKLPQIDSANDEEVVDVYEEEPINGFVSCKDIKNKYGN
mgnify:FL=1